VVFDADTFAKMMPDLYQQFLKPKKISSIVRMTVVELKDKQFKNGGGNE
jgi:hypothetical protein